MLQRWYCTYLSLISVKTQNSIEVMFFIKDQILSNVLICKFNLDYQYKLVIRNVIQDKNYGKNGGFAAPKVPRENSNLLAQSEVG